MNDFATPLDQFRIFLCWNHDTHRRERDDIPFAAPLASKSRSSEPEMLPPAV